MAIFKYTFYKYLKAPSTWVILLISMFIAGFLGGYLPMSALNFKKHDSIAQSYAILVIAVGGGITAFLSIFMSVFAGFKGASMFRDEVEDGTFLVILSKPQTRAKIIFQKWLALQVLMLCYSFLSVAAFVICVTIFDKGDTITNLVSIGIGTLKSNAFKIGSYVWAILIVVGLIFSSIAILLSTRLSSGATVGISISLGVIIPITGMVATFTKGNEYENIKNPTFQRMGLLLDTTANSSEDQIAALVTAVTMQQLGDGIPRDKVASTVEQMKGYIKQFFVTIDKSYKIIDHDTSTTQPGALYNISIATGEKDTFRDIWGFDFNYQLRQMASVVTNNMVPESLKPQLTVQDKNGISGINLGTEVIGHAPQGKSTTVNWLTSEIQKDMDIQIRWGTAAKDLITQIVSVFNDLFGIYDTTNPGVKVPNDKVVEKLLKSSGLPETYDIPKELRKYLDQSLVKTTLKMIDEAVYHPLLSIFDSSSLLKAAPSDWKIRTKKENLLLEYKNLYDKTYKDITKETKAPGEDMVNKDGFPSFEGTRQDGELYSLLKVIAEEHPERFAFVKTTEYVPGLTLLWIYLGIALGLVPLSYFIVKREDFR